MGDLPHRVQPDPDGRYTADVHVTPDGHARIGGRDYTPEEFADILRRNSDYDGRSIRLIGCDAGSNDFARRLSNELDTEVMAPNKPAWTDSNGRVFSSDYEVGPDGKMRPKIPPNGEWDTHHPDGSSASASDDAFTPDTADADKHDLDPDDARARGDQDHGGQDGEGAHRERVHKEILDKLNNPDGQQANEFRKQHWRDMGDSNGKQVFPRKDSAEQYDGVDLPIVERDKNGNFTIRDGKNPIKSEFVPGSRVPGTRDSLLNDRIWEADTLAAGRRGIQAYSAEANDAVKGIHRPDSAFTPPLDKFDQSGFNDVQSNHWNNKLGDLAAEHAVHDLQKAYPPPKGPLHRVDIPDRGANHFDQVYQDAQGNYVIVEAKGPNAGYNANGGYQQGHPDYVRNILDAMANRKGFSDGDPVALKEAEIAEQMRAQLDNGELKYFHVKAKVDEVDLSGYTDDQLRAMPAADRPSDTYAGYVRHEFDLSISVAGTGSDR